ncbi:B-box zinc finger protein [Wukongibacter baidiensis]|uniref:B-box zinc finger protein n=1 Tax=Wukongibacter baidiensis TaxID=1723361 RepID=UPI003D7FC81F
MNCNVHHKKEASFRCFECGEFICKECAVKRDEKIICTKCLENHVAEANRKEISITEDRTVNRYGRRYSSFLAFIFSLVPGAGQMYLGLMKRGLQLMVLFTIPIIVGNIFYFDGWFIILNVIVWFYSFFDCLHIRRDINEGKAIKDELIYDISMIDVKELNYKHLGIGLIAVGGVVILNNGLSELGRFIYNHFSYGDDFHRLFRFIRQSSFPVLLIIVGVYLLKKSRAEKEV